MYINIVSTIDDLSAENTKLNEAIVTCENHKAKIKAISFSSVGLSGKAVDAIKENIAKRPALLQVRISAFGEIVAANTNNISYLGTLKEEIGMDFADTDVYDEEIRLAKDTLADVQEQIDDLALKVYTGDAFDLIISQISLEYLKSAKEAQETLIEFYESKIQAVENYVNVSSECYSAAQTNIQDILAKSTDTINTYIATGVYDAGNWQDALNAEIGNDWKLRLEMAAPYLTAEEYEALKAAYEPDGVITSTEIYDPGAQEHKFNEFLYRGLAKLPTSLVPSEVVDACADAYTSMWTGGGGGTNWGGAAAIDYESIERFYELSYLYDSRLNVAPGYPNSTTDPETAKYLTVEFSRQSGLLSRINDVMLSKLPGLSIDGIYYQPTLAAANLLNNVVAISDKVVCASDISLDGFVSDGGRNNQDETRSKDAVIATLTFNTPYIYGSHSTDDFFADTTMVTSITGDPSAVCLAMNDIINNAAVENDRYAAFGDIAVGVATATLSVLGLIFPPSIALAITVVTAACSIGSAIQAGEDANKFVQTIDGNFWDTAAASTNSPVFGDMGFALGFVSNCNSDNSDNLNTRLNIVIPNESNERISKSINGYNLYNSTKPSVQKETYSYTQLIGDLQSDLFETVDNGSEGFSGDDENSHNATNDYLAWCNTEADLVYKVGETRTDGTSSNVGDDAPKNEHTTNYEHSIRKDDSGYEYCYRYEYEAEHPEAAK